MTIGRKTILALLLACAPLFALLAFCSSDLVTTEPSDPQRRVLPASVPVQVDVDARAVAPIPSSHPAQTDDHSSARGALVPAPGVLLYFAIAAAIVVMVLYLAIDRFVLRRIRRIIADVTTLHASSRLLEVSGNDELAELAGSINELVIRQRSYARQIDLDRDKLRAISACLPGIMFRCYFDQADALAFDFVSDGAERILGDSAQDLIADAALLVNRIDPEQRDQVVRSLRDAAQRRQSWNAEFAVLGAPGCSWFRAQALPATGPSGEAGLAGLLLDITASRQSDRLLQDQARDLQAQAAELRDARDRADAANRAKSEFLANMSHEIRTPMTAILGYAELLGEQNLSAAERDENVGIIRRNGEHLISVINDILDRSKIEANHLVLERAEFAAVQIAEDVVQSLRPRARGKGLTLETEIQYPLPRTIAGDPLRLRQVLVNLVGNAIKFTETGGARIRVSYTRNERAVRFEIIDTGVGMSSEQVARLFRPFTQVDASATRRFGGTGLGLSISQRLVHLMGGEIKVRSAAGEGSNFYFNLPAADAAEEHMLFAPGETQEPQARKAQQSLDLSSFGARVLLAEDGLDNQRLISFLLRKSGLSVVLAENGWVAVHAFERSQAAGDHFDLILMDMQMPELDGYSAVRELRSKGCRLPIVALTAHAMAGDREKCLAAGCDDYLTKPIDRTLLITTVARFLADVGTRRAA